GGGRVGVVGGGDVGGGVHAPVRVEWRRFVLDGELHGVECAGEWVFSLAWLTAFEEELRSGLAAADPLDPGVAAPATPWAADVLPLLPFERRGAKLYVPGTVPNIGARAGEADAVERAVADGRMRATKLDGDDELARYLEGQGRIVRLGDGYAIGAEAYEVARDVLLAECSAQGGITLGRFRDLVGTGRRDAQ